MFTVVEDYTAFSDYYEEYIQLMQNGALQSSVSGFEPTSQGGIEPVDEIVPQVFNASTKTGSYRFPIISTFKNWRVETYKLSGIPIKKIAERPATLRIAKDDGVTDIIILDNDGNVADFSILEAEGLKIEKPTDSRTCKRLSRMLRLSLAFGTFTPDEMPVVEMEVDKDLWDGMNLIAREALDMLTMYLPWQVQEVFRRTHRFEGTVMAPYQIKGHFLVRDRADMPGQAMIAYPKGSEKREISFNQGIFVDMRPVIGHKHLMADIQTLINHYHVLFDNKTLMGWLHEESVKFLEAMKTGDAEDRMEWLFSAITDDYQFEQLMKMPLFEFLASGGKLHESPTMTRHFGKQWAKRLESKSLLGHRMPIKPGFRLYITSAATGKHKLPRGMARVDFKRATLFISDDDWAETVATLGGADADDAVNIVTDGTTLFVTRNPNMRGEYMTYTIDNPEVLEENGIETVFIDWGRLHKIVQLSDRKYGELRAHEAPENIIAYPEFVNWLIGKISSKIGVLGRHINVLASCTLTEGEEPICQPATGEAIIDASVKDLMIDLTPVIDWDYQTARNLVKKPVCQDAMRRLMSFVDVDFPFQVAKNHWLDNLTNSVRKHVEWFLEQVKHLSDAATPPEAALVGGGSLGRQMKATYSHYIRMGYLSGKIDETNFEEAIRATQEFLAGLTADEREKAILQAYTVSAFTATDSVVWQKTIAPLTFAALRKIGVLGFPEWDGYGVTASGVRDYPKTAHIQANGTWFTLLLSTGEKVAQMRDVPRLRRAALKENVHRNSSRMIGRKVHFQKEGDRLICLNDTGVRLGTVAKGHEERVGFEMTVIAAEGFDGNLRVVLK